MLKQLVEDLQNKLEETDANASKALDSTVSNKAEIDDLNTRFASLLIRLEQMQSEINKKVNSDDLDDILRQMQPKGDGPSEPMMSVRDLNLLKDLGKRMEALEKQVNDHIGDTENRFKKTSDDIKFLED